MNGVEKQIKNLVHEQVLDGLDHMCHHSIWGPVWKDVESRISGEALSRIGEFIRMALNDLPSA